MDPADPLLPKILVLVILILINAFFAAAEIAVISLSETKLRKQAEEAAAPKQAVTCPWCGATTTPDESGRCEFCGGSVKN